MKEIITLASAGLMDVRLRGGIFKIHYNQMTGIEAERGLAHKVPGAHNRRDALFVSACHVASEVLKEQCRNVCDCRRAAREVVQKCGQRWSMLWFERISRVLPLFRRRNTPTD